MGEVVNLSVGCVGVMNVKEYAAIDIGIVNCVHAYVGSIIIIVVATSIDITIMIIIDIIVKMNMKMININSSSSIITTTATTTHLSAATACPAAPTRASASYTKSESAFQVGGLKFCVRFEGISSRRFDVVKQVL